MKLLDHNTSLQFVVKLLQESQSVNIGLKSQYFIADNLLNDLDAKVIHGVKSKPDIILSDPVFLSKLIKELKSEISDTTDIEVKSFAWNYRSFSNALNSYRKRKQKMNLFIGISPILLYPSNETITFNSLSEGIISVVVVSMEAIADNNKEIWDQLLTLTERQIPEGFDIKEMPLDKILEIINFRKIVEIDKFNEEQMQFNEEQMKFNKDVEKKLDAILEILKQLKSS